MPNATTWTVACVVAAICASVASAEWVNNPFEITPSRVKAKVEQYGNPSEKAARSLPRFLFGDEKDIQTKDDVFWAEGLYLPSRNSSIVKNEQCVQDVDAVIRVLQNEILQGLLLVQGHVWPLLMPDSWGKFGDGVLDGNWHLWGFPWECGMVKASEDIGFPYFLHTNFTGKYCLIHTESLEDYTEEDRAPRIPTLATPNTTHLFQFATCIPSSCTSEDMTVSLNAALKVAGKYARNVDCGYNEEKEWSDGDSVYVALLCLFGALTLLAALADWLIGDKEHLRNGQLRFLLVFSITRSLNKIFEINPNPGRSVITCLHGMRVMSMAWIVWVHSFYVKANVSKNTVGQLRLTSDIIDQTFVNASFSVDTFFFISGLLAVYGVLREDKRSGKVNWLKYYIQRFIRLLPAIAMTCGMAATLAKFALSGPYGGEIERNLVENCQTEWWRDVFFLSNVKTTPSCLPHCWYTTVDTQIFVFLPIILIPLLWKPKMGLLWMALVTLVFLSVPPILYAMQDLVPDQLFMTWWRVAFGLDPESNLGYPNNSLYDKPWGRAGTYLIGCWAGYLIFKFTDKKVKMPIWQVIIGWLLAAAVASAVLFGMTEYNSFNRGDDFYPEPLTEALSVSYGGFSRPAWALSLLWLVFACHNGYGGLINEFLSHPSWQPLSRLSFTIYLVTYPVQLMYIGTITLPLYVDHVSTILETCGYLFMGGLIAVWLSVITETPMVGLQKLITQRPVKERTEEEIAKN